MPSYQAKVELVGRRESFHQFERNVMLQSLDTHWREHLAALDHLRQGIHLRGYAQKNPKQEYKREAFELFEDAARQRPGRRQPAADDRPGARRGTFEETAPHADVQNVQYHHADYDDGARAPAKTKSRPDDAAAACAARKSAATTLARAVRARNTNSATES